MANSIFDTSRERKLTILTTDNPLLFNLDEFPPIADLPPGRVRVRLRADEIKPSVFVRNASGIRRFLVNVDADGKLSRGPEVAANYRHVAYPGGPRKEGATALGFDRPDMENVTETAPGVYDCGPPVCRFEIRRPTGGEPLISMSCSARAISSPSRVIQVFEQLFREWGRVSKNSDGYVLEVTNLADQPPG